MSMSFACHAVEEEARHVTLACYRFLEEVRIDTIVQNDLFVLALFTENCVPKFTAAGFFSISRHTILSLLGTILTYTIILVQFK